jgi:hypothetical protein
LIVCYLGLPDLRGFNGVRYRIGAGHLTESGNEVMAKEQRSFGTSRGRGPHASRRGLLQAGLAIGTLALGHVQPSSAGHCSDAIFRLPQL